MEEYINDAGDLYTVEEINQAAEENNTTFEDIIKRNKLSLKKQKVKATEEIAPEEPGKPKPVVKKDAVATAKSTASKSVKPSSVSSVNPFGEVKTFDPLGLEKLRKTPAPKPVKATALTGQGYKYDSRGYLVPKDTKEPSLWDDIKDFARNLFPESEEDNNGKLTYYDQTPIKEQQALFNKDSKDAMNATGKFEFLKDYKPEDRAVFVSKFVPKPNYTEKRYNVDTDSYETAPRQEAVDYIMKDIDPSKFKTKAQLDQAIALNTKKLASQDKAFEFEQQYAKAKAAPLINSKIAEIKKKYSLTTPESVAKATKELQDYAAKTTTDFLINSDGFQRLNQSFASVENQAALALTKQYERSQEGMLSFYDTGEKIGKALEKRGGLVGVGGKIIQGVGRLAEGVQEGFINVGVAGMQTGISLKQGELTELNNFYNKYKDKADNEKFNLPETWNDLMAGAENIGQVQSLFGNNVPKTFGEARERLKKGINKINSNIESKVIKIADTKEYTDLFNKADLKDGIQLNDVFTLVGQQAPNLALTGAAAVTRNPLLVGLSTANIFTQEYGNQYYDTIETGLREDLGRTPTRAEIAEAIGQGKYANRAEAAAGAAVSASLEYASQLNILKNTGRALGFGNNTTTTLGSLFRGEIKNFSKSIAQSGVNVAKSGLGEYLTESAQQAISQSVKGLQLQGDASKYIDLREINEAGKAGGIVGSVFPFAGTIKTQTGIELRAAATKVATMFDLSSANMSNLVQVNNFFNEAAKNVEERFKVGDITKEQKQTELETLGTIRSAGVKIPSEFDSKAKEEALNLMLEKANIEKAIDGKDKDLVTPEIERLKTISSELATIAISERERIRIETNKETLSQSIGSIENIVDKEGNKVYENAIGSGKSVEVFETAAEAQTAYDKWAIENNEETQDITLSDGFALPNGQILINKERAAEVGALNVAPHELLHNILKSEFSDPARKVQLKDKFLSILSKAERTKLDKRMEAYTAEELERAPDEYMTQYFELLGNGTITWSDNVKETLVSLWNSVIKPIFVKQGFKNIEFEDGRDIYNFIKDYAKTIKKGKISERATELLKAGETISGVTKMSKTRSEILKEQLNELEDNEGDYDPDDFDQRVKSLEGQIKRAIDKEKTEVKSVVEKEISEEDAVKEIVNNEKGSISSDKVQKIYEEKGLNGSDEIIKLFRPITKKIVDKRRDAPGFDRELLTDEIETGKGGILDLIQKYDPKQGTPLAAYINKYLPVRAIATSRRILDQDFKKDVTEEKGLMAAETVVETKEKPKYKNALESKVFTTEALESANKKVLSVIRTLKSKINTPVSLNKTVTPLVAEIRDQIGKLLDIDVKTEMGGKKDNQLQDWLLKNKQYILENMTTTWLMGKDGQGGMPIAIQKQIDGKWVSYPDWVGQKIDREKTSTDNAGRTSGAELVRRLPNVNNNISDSQFLDQVIGPDGNPIRGRKESLAKAIAEETAFDIINSDFENEGPIFDAFKTNQERLGVELIDNVATEISRQIERGNVKFSLTKDEFRLAAANLFHAASDFGINSKEVKDVLNNFPLDVQNKLKEYAFEEYIDFLIKFQDIKEKARGTVYEKMILKELNKLKLKGVQIITKKVKGFDSTGEGDIQMQIGKDRLNIEVKLNALAQMGSASLDIDLNKKDFSISKELILPEEFVSKLKENIPNFNEYKKAAESIDVNTKTWPYKMLRWQHEYLRDKGFQKALTVSVDTDQSIIEQLYNSKNVYYINIGNQGLFYLGKDILNLGVPKLNSKVRLTARLVRGGEYNRIRLFPTLIDFKQKSKYNIDNAASNNALFTRYKENLAIKQSKTTEDAVVNSLDPKNSVNPKGISVFDFDDTVGLTKSNVLYTMPDGTKGKLNAEEFAKEGSKLLSEGATFDFSEFSKVTNGKPGPMVEKMKKMIGKFGPDNFFILTARPADSAGPIHDFLKSIGIEIPLKNITGLGNSTAQAKADWMTAKAAEGYNDFYFADDATQNVEAVKKALEIPGVSSKIQQAMIKFSLTSKQDLKWRQGDEDLSTNFKVGNNSYRIALREIGSMEYSDDINNALLNIVENNNLDYDKTIGDIDGNAYDVEFSDKKRGTGITGTGNAAEVFGTVLNGVIELANKKNIKAFTFNAKEPSRIKLYNSMTNIIADRLGWASKAENGTYLLYDKSLIQSAKEKTKTVTTKIPNNSSWTEGNNGRFYQKDVKAGDSELKLQIANADVKVDFDWDAELSDENFVELIKENNLNPESFKYVFAPQNTKEFVFINSNKELENIPANDISIISNAINEFVDGNNIKTIILSSDNISDGNKNIDNLFKTIATNVSKDLNFNLYSKEGSFILTEKEATIGSEKGLGSLPPVKDVLNVADVKSPINQSRVKFSKTISSEFNKIIEENTGMENYKVFSDIVARRRGAKKNMFDFYVPPSAADFELLLYNFIGKGTRGEEQQKFFSDALLKPYANGNDLMDAARQSIKKDYKALTNQFPDIKKKIEKLTPDGDYTYDQAIRVAMWTEEGVEIPGISQRDQAKLTDLVNNDPELTAFKQGLIVTGRQGKGWVTPTEYWDASTIISDLHNLTEGEGRKKFLAEFIDNAQEMFGKWENGRLVGPNMNKVEAVYGTNVREAIEDVLYRMTTGKNRSQGKDKETSAWSNWVNGSTGTIMFLNTRSAALQLIGAVNFLNLRDNNPIAAGKAFANQKQYWEDFATIWNSDKMKERRGGLKEDVAAAEIANAAAGSKNKANAVISYLLKIGYTPTQLADSFAIASGGSPFYRNRIKTYLKEGLTQDEAETAAWSDFTKVSDETQQSGDPRDISKQQASGAGRLLLTFQNTAMQQSRIVKKSFLDLKNGRGDAKTHIAKITYYLAIQNIMFATLQQGLFAVLFSDDDKDEEGKKKKAKDTEKKMYDIADGVLDTILRGTGFAGGIIATLKNMYMKYQEEEPKDFKADYTKVVLEGANISPPIGSKLRKLYSGFQQTKFERDLIKERGWGVMQDGRVHLGPMYGVTGKVVEATTNLPMDRLVNKIENVSQAMNSKNTALQRVMVGIGFTPYSVGIEDTEADQEIRAKAKEFRAEEGKIKAKETRERTKDSIRTLPIEERMKLKREAALKRREEKLKKRKRKMG
jgi:hypothetical protein